MNIVNFDKIKELAGKKKIPLDKLANSLGLARSTIYNYINGTYQIKVSELYNISKILEVNIDELLSVPEEEKIIQAAEPEKKYGITCIECIKKQGVIDHLKETVKEKEDKIKELEDLCKKMPGQNT